MTLKKIRLELARTPDHPEGSAACGYEFTAPLDAKGKLDPRAWDREKAKCIVRRFWTDAGDELGHLVHHRGRNWVFSYVSAKEDDEPLFRLDKHAFALGGYVSVTEHDGVERPFRVVSVQSAV
jgi:hypothetical protein